MPLKASPTGIIRPFWLTAKHASTPSPSTSKGVHPKDAMESTTSNAEWSKSSRTFLIAAKSEVTPVDVSVWATRTPWIFLPASVDRTSRKASGSTPCCQPVSNQWTSKPWASHISPQRWLKWPLSHKSTGASTSNRLVTVASHAP